MLSPSPPPPASTALSPPEQSSYDVRDSVAAFASYEEYLLSLVRADDVRFLEDEALARDLVELGARGGVEPVIRRAEFAQRKQADAEKHLQKDAIPRPLAGAGKDLSGRPLLAALAEREELVRNGKLAVIVFLRGAAGARGGEVSGYIDYGARLKAEAFEAYFDGRRRLLPKPSDLSFFNWETNTTAVNSSVNFQVIVGETGLLFKAKRDRKVIDVDPTRGPGDNTTRTDIPTQEYAQVVFFDHVRGWGGGRGGYRARELPPNTLTPPSPRSQFTRRKV